MTTRSERGDRGATLAAARLRLVSSVLVGMCLVLHIPCAVSAQEAPSAEQEFSPPGRIPWGIGKDYFHLRSGGGFAYLEGDLRVSLQVSAEYLVADSLGIRLGGDIPVYWEDPVANYDIYWDNLIHFLPYRRTDLYSGLGTGVRISSKDEAGTHAAPLLSIIGGLSLFPSFPYAFTLEGRAAWSVYGETGENLWLIMGSFNVGVVF